MNKPSKLAWVVCLAMGLGVAAQAQDDGATIYKSKCEKCHGADGMSHTFAGRMTGAAKFNSPEVMKMSDADIATVIKDGKKKMPAFRKKLTDEQINTVIAYVHTLEQPQKPQ